MAESLPGGIGKWGPGVLGEEEYARQQAMVATGAWKYGPGVVDVPEPEPEPEVPAKAKRARKPKTEAAREG